MTFRDGKLIEVNNQFAVGDAKAYVAWRAGLIEKRQQSAVGDGRCMSQCHQSPIAVHQSGEAVTVSTPVRPRAG
jgi:hypothetical protein